MTEEAEGRFPLTGLFFNHHHHEPPPFHPILRARHSERLHRQVLLAITGANDRVNVGLISFGLIGRIHMAAIKEQRDARITAVCDVHRGRLEAAAKMAGGSPARYGDFRKLLADRNVDAV